MHVGLSNLDCRRPRRPVDPLKLQLALPQEVDQDVDADVDRRADDEEQEPHVNELEKIIIKFNSKVAKIPSVKSSVGGEQTTIVLVLPLIL